jgi:hypothetical protein
MNTHPLDSCRRLGAVTLMAIGLAAGGVALAFADTPVPDPPVPDEGPFVMASADPADADCGCMAQARGTLQVRDIQGQVDRHVAQWQALHTARDENAKRHLRPKNIVEGVVGFPVRHYRLAADDDGPAGR